MGAPYLEVIDGGNPAICGAATRSGDPCRNPPGKGGRCWLPSHRDGPVETPDELPDAPGHLGELGREYWNYHVKRCQRAGVMDIVDLTVIEKAAEVAEILRRCWKNVQAKGPDVPDKNNSSKTNPALSKYNSLMPDYRQLTKQIDRWVAKGGRQDEDTDDGWGGW